MLQFQFSREYVNGRSILRPRIPVMLASKANAINVAGVLDSGADRTVIPLDVAIALGLPRLYARYTRDVGGETLVYDAQADLFLRDELGRSAEIPDVPIYIAPDCQDVIIGRAAVFDAFRVSFEQYSNRILLEAS